MPVEHRRFLVAIVGGLLAAPLATEGQPAGKVFRIGILTTVPLATLEEFSLPSLSKARSSADDVGRCVANRYGLIQWALYQFGYVEGQNIVMKLDGERRTSFPPSRPSWFV